MKGLPKSTPFPELQEWLDKQIESPEAMNPCVQAFGRGPTELTCKTCVHLVVHQPSEKRYYKCDLREFTNGPGSDHRVRWPACARYSEKSK